MLVSVTIVILLNTLDQERGESCTQLLLRCFDAVFPLQPCAGTPSFFDVVQHPSGCLYLLPRDSRPYDWHYDMSVHVPVLYAGRHRL